MSGSNKYRLRVFDDWSHVLLVPTFPTTEYHFPTPLEPVRVPPGCYPIEVVQYWRGEFTYGRPLSPHWAIVICTSGDRGNTHEIVGDMHTYTTQDHFDVPLDERGDWHGGHIVGFVSPTRLHEIRGNNRERTRMEGGMQ